MPIGGPSGGLPPIRELGDSSYDLWKQRYGSKRYGPNRYKKNDLVTPELTEEQKEQLIGWDKAMEDAIQNGRNFLKNFPR
ncbi:hypothetical protein IPN35_00710 [Candidatus Peregrinibacteria bacterium]|nr:MAG: hypothetical protein IPN35_00710 [Candidatus Peregrinibacteria bacterium]